MGYYSDVTIAFYTTEDHDETFPILKNWFYAHYPVADAMADYRASVEMTDTAIVVTYENVKWYSSYEHVVAVDTALGAFQRRFDHPNTPSQAAYDFIRVGEEVEDIEMRHSSGTGFRLNVLRDIIFE